METTPELNRALDSLHALTDALREQRAGLAVVRADGRWHIEQAGTIRPRTPPLSTDVCSALISAVHRHGPTTCLDGGWWIRPHQGGTRRSVVLQPRPRCRPDGLSDHTLELLQTRLRPETNGVIFGPDRSARTGVLLSLVRWLPAEFIVHVGEVPPAVPDELSLLHVPPPADDRDRHRLATLCEGASAVLVDGPVDDADIRAATTGAESTARWLSVATSDPDAWSTGLQATRPLSSTFEARIGVRGSASAAIRLDHFSMHRSGEWHILMERDGTDADATSEETTVAESTDGDPIEVTRSYDHQTPRADDESTTNPETPSRIRERPDSLRESSSSRSESNDLRESGEIDISGQYPAADNQSASSLGEESSASEEIRGERIDDDLPRLVASRDVDDVDMPELDPQQLRRTFEGDVDIQSLRAERRKHRQSGDDPDDAPAPRPEPSTGLANESSSARVVSVQNPADPTSDPEVADEPSTAEEFKTDQHDDGDLDDQLDETDLDDEPETDVLGADQSEAVHQATEDQQLDELADDLSDAGLAEDEEPATEADPNSSDIPETTEFTVPEEPEADETTTEQPPPDVRDSRDDETERLEVESILDGLEEDSYGDSS